MKPRSHTMHAGSVQHGTAHIGGQEVNVTINMEPTTKGAPIHLPGDTRIPEGVVSAKTQQEMEVGMNGGSFSNPMHNVRRLGLREGMHVADFGTGSGAYTLALAEAVGTSGKVYAVDVQRDLLTRVQNEVTQKGYENVEIVWGDIENAEGARIRDTALDAVVLSNTLFQLQNKITAVKEAWRVLKPGGILAVIDWSDSFGGMGPARNAVITQAEATLLCTDNGFAFKREFPAGDHHYGLLFVKMLAGESTGDVIAQSRQKEKDYIARTIAQELI